MIQILRNMFVDSLVNQMQFYVLLDAVIVVWPYMDVNYGT